MYARKLYQNMGICTYTNFVENMYYFVKICKMHIVEEIFKKYGLNVPEFTDRYFERRTPINFNHYGFPVYLVKHGS